MKIPIPRTRAMAVAILLFATLATNVSAQPFCGDTIFTNTTLSNDLDCMGRGLTIGASNVTLDCDGHTIEATGSSRVVQINSGLSNVTVRDCVLTGIADTEGLRVEGDTTDILITGNAITTSGNSTRGIRARGTSFSEISNNSVSTSGPNGTGIRMENSPDNLVNDNTIFTSGPSARGFRLQTGSNHNLLSGNVVHTTGVGSAGVLLRAGADGNTMERNVLRTDNTQPVRIESSSDNVFHENSLASASAWLLSRRFGLQNGGMSVHPDGRIFAVENSFGGDFGVGTATAFMEIDPATGAAINPIRLTQGGADLGFGFDALEITPDWRFLALRGNRTGEMYEINPDTGEVTFLYVVNIMGNSIPVNGLESDGGANLLATTNLGALFSIDVMSGTATLIIGNTGLGWTDLAVDPTTGIAYAVSRFRDEASSTGHLYVIDTLTGLILGEIGDTGLPFVSDMDFTTGGTLYANNSSLLMIDPVTAATESVGGFGEDPSEPPSENNSLSKTTLVAVGGSGSVHYPGTLAVPSGVLVNVSTAELDISFNRAFVDSTTYPFLDQKAIITLLGLPGKKRRLLVDEDDDGEFERCRGRQCKLRLFSGGTLVFKVNGFTTYSSEERTKKKDDDDDDDHDD